MTHSESVDQIATALAKAQGQMSGASKDSANPFFKSKYADLASVWDACRKPLSDNGLSILQSPSAEGSHVCVETLLMHSSGQWIRDIVSASAKDDAPQSVGSTITYLRRYALQSFAGVAPEDDDAEAATNRGKAQPVAVPTVPTGYDNWLSDLAAVVQNGTEALQAMWKASKAEYRAHLTSTDPKAWELMKKGAANVRVPVSA